MSPARAARHPPRPGADHGISLLDDTWYRRTRHAVANAVHAVDDRYYSRRSGRTRLLFEAASPVSLSVFQPVLDRLQRDDRLEFWYMTSDGTWDASAIFDAASTRQRVVDCSRARWMKFDAYVNTDFWNTTWLNRRARRVHFFHGVAGKYGLDAPTRIAPVVASFDRLMFANRDRLQQYAAAGLVDADGPAAALIGYPKVDCLVDGSLDAAAIRRDIELDEALPTVLYAPTWSPHSSLNSVGIAVIQALAALDVNVIVKLHDRSLDGSERGAGGINWRQELARLEQSSRIHVARGANASPYMLAADILVTDHSSIGFEYMLLDRPIVVIECPELIRQADVNRRKVALLRGAATVVPDAAAAAAAVVRALSHPDGHSAARRSIAADLFYGAGGATARAVRSIYDLLEMPAPEIPDPASETAHHSTLVGNGAALETRATFHV